MIIMSAACGSVEDKNFRVHFPDGRGTYLYILFRSKTMLYVEGKYIPVDAGTGIFYDKSQHQSYYGCDETEFNHDYVSFDLNSEIEKSVFANIPLGKPMFHVDAKYITNLIALIEQEKYLPSHNAEGILSSLGLALLYRAGEKIDALSVDDKRRNSQHTAFYRLRDEIYKKPAFDWSIEYAANEFFLSRFYFQKLYKQFFEVTFQNDLICARISLAKKLLLYSHNKIFEIAEMCGYKISPVNSQNRLVLRQGNLETRQFRNNKSTGQRITSARCFYAALSIFSIKMP